MTPRTPVLLRALLTATLLLAVPPALAQVDETAPETSAPAESEEADDAAGAEPTEAQPEGDEVAPEPAEDSESEGATEATESPDADDDAADDDAADDDAADDDAADEDEAADEEGRPRAGRGHGAPHARSLIPLPWGLRLNGRFDVAWERYGYTNDLTEGKDRFANYHHLLFLSRRSKDDPFFFSVEFIDLTYFHAGVRFRPKDGFWSLKASAGKVMVPFGAEPLFHHSYGGRVGADQELLPRVFARYGATGSFSARFGPVGLKADAYLVHGYDIDTANEVLDLRSGLSPLDDIKPAFGTRLAASFGPAALYYSIYLNPMRFNRLLVMQAVDFALAGIPDIPVLEDITFGLGLLRADVVGGWTQAYYHFADYIELKYQPLDWLWFQYRAGMRTMDNRKGAWFDSSRRDTQDTATHSLTAGVTFYGATIQLQHVWQLEAVDEIPNDFLRVMATYAF